MRVKMKADCGNCLLLHKLKKSEWSSFNCKRILCIRWMRRQVVFMLYASLCRKMSISVNCYDGIRALKQALNPITAALVGDAVYAGLHRG